MKKAAKLVMWVVGALVATYLYLITSDDARSKWVIGAILGYGFWLVLKQMTDAESRTSARLDRIEDLLTRQVETGLSASVQLGLAELVHDQRRAKRAASDET